MINRIKPIKTRLLKSDDPFNDFKIINIRDRASNNALSRDVIFTRVIGYDDKELYIKRIEEISSFLSDTTNTFLCISQGLERSFDSKDLLYATDIANKFIVDNNSLIAEHNLKDIDLGIKLSNESLDWSVKKGIYKITKTFFKTNNNITILRNFIIKLVLWSRKYVTNLCVDDTKIPKVLFIGDIKRQECYFLLLLSLIGCDILYINPINDISIDGINIDKYSTLLSYPNLAHIQIELSPVKKEVPLNDSPDKNHKQETAKKKSTINFERNRKKRNTNKTKPVDNSESEINFKRINTTKKPSGPKKSYEELALLSESVVKIQTFDENSKDAGGGSGIVINSEGYILTNLHVVDKCTYIGVLFENDKKLYMTTGIIKYHTNYDLAIIKVERVTKPLKISSNPLIRGEKIVAIGSPLGLFNTISEGIVSGFRRYDDGVNIVQITAPTSPGSSGGAVLNLYGEVVGISHAGAVDIESIGLVIPSEYIHQIAEQYL